jgi:geranylgeranyl pyrophosphate synthase
MIREVLQTSSLVEHLKRGSDGFEDFQIQNLLQDFALKGGKNFRIHLGLKLSECYGLDSARALPFLQAAEMLHAATLVHDDVVDQASQRRGRPSLNASTSNRHAILSGDYLLAKCIRSLSVLQHERALFEMTTTLEEIVEGEWLQLEANKNLYIDAQGLEKIARKKTGALFEWCCRVPAFVQDDYSDYDALGEFGRTLGLSFQLVDDLLDFKSGTGKPMLQDLKEGQVNFVTQALMDRWPGLRNQWSWDPARPSWSESQLELALESVQVRVDGQFQLLKIILDQLGRGESSSFSRKHCTELWSWIDEMRRRNR